MEDIRISFLERFLQYVLETTIVNPEGYILEQRQVVQQLPGKIKIEIYHSEHPPPHFHVISTDINASFDIVTGQQINGIMVSTKVRKQIEYFHRNHKALLIDIWNKTRPSDCPVGPIV